MTKHSTPTHEKHASTPPAARETQPRVSEEKKELTNPNGRGASNSGEVGDQESADKTAADAKKAEKDADLPEESDGRGRMAQTPIQPAGATPAAPGAAPAAGAVLQTGGNNPQDGTPIVKPTGDVTRPDATKGPLHNPGVVVEAGRADPSPTTVVAPSMAASAKRDMTDPSRKD